MIAVAPPERGARALPLPDGRSCTGTPVGMLCVIAVAGAAVLLAAGSGILPPRAAAIAGVTGSHGTMLAIATAWAQRGAPAARVAGAALPVAVLAMAATAARAHPAGAIAYLGVPASVLLLGSGRLRRLGLGVPVSKRALLAGAGIGALLGAHVLVSAARTLGYHVRVDRVAAIAAGILYDIGANVFAAECLFRGAVFGGLLRRWSFWPAAVVATTACVGRYLLDPLLPWTTEIVVGAVFYVSVQSFVSCWLLWWSGSLVPGIVSGVLFFAAYRALSGG